MNEPKAIRDMMPDLLNQAYCSQCVSTLFKKAKRVFSEDECAPDAESIGAAWHRLFGEPMPDEPFASADEGDAMIFLYQNGRMAQIGPPKSGWTEIRVIED